MIKYFGVFGNPIKHSLSPQIFHTLFTKLDLKAHYDRYLLPPNASPVAALRGLNLQGANVTIPFKEIAFKDCDKIKGIACDIGSVNTLVMESDQVVGYNTDAEGFYFAISQYISPKNALIIGAGGSSKAIAFILRMHHIPTLIINRSSEKLEHFTKQGYNTSLSADLDTKQSFDLIINTTSAGLEDKNLPLPHTNLQALFNSIKDKKNALICDIIYGHITPFIALAKQSHLKVIDGLDMLHMQAAISATYFLHAMQSLSKQPLPYVDKEMCFKIMSER